MTLPSGKLREPGKLLSAGLWNEALDLLGSTPAFKDPKKEAYRLYCIGVAQEALAYQSPNLETAKLQLERALGNYRRSTELRPSEEFLWEPRNRTAMSLLLYDQAVAQSRALDEAKKSVAEGGRAADQTPAQGGSRDLYREVVATRKFQRPIVTNDTVIQWVKAGLSEDYITASIRHAPEASFYMSKAEQVRLRQAGVTGRMLKAMEHWGRQTSQRLSVAHRILFTVAYTAWVYLIPLLAAR